MTSIPDEHYEAVCLKGWLDKKGLLYFHSPNESGHKSGFHEMLIQKRKKDEGMKAGCPDYCIFIKSMLICVELKRQRPIGKKGQKLKSPSKISDEQIEWINALNELDYCIADICYGWEDAVQFINYCIDKSKK